MRETTKLAWGPDCGPDRRWLETQLRGAREERHPGAKLDPREVYPEAQDGPGDLFSGLDEGRDRGDF